MTTRMTPSILESIKTATSNPYPCTLWYDNADINADIAIAIKNGWVRRPSHTQVEWTNEGIAALRAYKVEIGTIFPDYVKSEDIKDDCETVEEYLTKYYKTDRFTGRGKEYAQRLIKSYKKDILDRGYTLISHHDSVTGRGVYFTTYKSEKPTQQELEQQLMKDECDEITACNETYYYYNE